MSFASMMAAIAGAEVRQDQSLKTKWDACAATNQFADLQRVCGFGQNIPDLREAALFYTLLYGQSHYDAVRFSMSDLKKALRAREARWLVMDFGAGPGTALVALASSVLEACGAPLAVTYVHVDRSVEMGKLACKFFHADDNVGGGSRIALVTDLMLTTNAEVASWSSDCTHGMFVFSYVLCQQSVDRHAVERFAWAIKTACSSMAGKPAYIVMADANLTHTQWPVLAQELTAAGLPVRSDPSITTHTSQYLNLGGTNRNT